MSSDSRRRNMFDLIATKRNTSKGKSSLRVSNEDLKESLKNTKSHFTINS